MAFGIGTPRRTRSGRRQRVGMIVTFLALSLVVPTGPAAPVAQAADKGLGRPDVPDQRVSKVKEVDGPGAKEARAKVAKDKKANAERARQARAEREAAWPEQGHVRVELDAGKRVRAEPGGLPVSIAPAGGKNGAESGTTARITVLDQKAARDAGITGVLLTAEADGAGRAELGIDYSGFASAVGGGWASRLRLVQLPACALDTPEKAACRTATPVASDNDLAGQTVTASVPLAETSDGPSPQLATAATAQTAVFALAAADPGSGESSSGSGDYSATELSESSSWEAGDNSGSFSWNQDFNMPPAAAGPTPELSLSYDSATVDGRTATTNNQGSAVGEGFSLTESYIERSYGSCDDDGHDDVFDQCWKYDNAQLVLNGKSTRLVKVSGTWDSTWRLENDDASTVTRSTGADNGDGDGEYWTVITGDGTKYVFGLNKLDGAADQRTNSTWTVPVFGDDSGEPGYGNGGSFADRAVTQAWRWNLDYVEDTHGNASTYWYAKESNHYKKNKADHGQRHLHARRLPEGDQVRAAQGRAVHRRRRRQGRLRPRRALHRLRLLVADRGHRQELARCPLRRHLHRRGHRLPGNRPLVLLPQAPHRHRHLLLERRHQRLRPGGLLGVHAGVPGRRGHRRHLRPRPDAEVNQADRQGR